MHHTYSIYNWESKPNIWLENVNKQKSVFRIYTYSVFFESIAGSGQKYESRSKLLLSSAWNYYIFLSKQNCQKKSLKSYTGIFQLAFFLAASI